MKLSIIICVYNTAKEYLTECLESITRSTVKQLNGGYEICMVDDGSSIDYSELVSKYGIKYLKTENCGILSARRTGVQIAEGEYIVFCDSDDTVSHNYHMPMVECAEKSSADIVINDWAFYTPNMKYYCTNDETIRKNIDAVKGDTLLLFMKNRGRQHSFYVLWNKLYKAELLRKSLESLFGAGYPLNASYAEDAAINFFAWKYAKRVINIHTGFYFYRIHPSQTVNAASEERLLSQIEDMSECFKIMRSNIEDEPHKEKIEEDLDAWISLMSRAHFATASANGYKNLFPKIQELYNTQKLKMPIFKDSSDYLAKTLLGINFTEVDAALLSLWDSDEIIKVSYRKKDTYTARCVDYLAEHEKVLKANLQNADIAIPKLRYPLKQRILHNKYVYALGLLLFKKGSKIRGLLKKMV